MPRHTIRQPKSDLDLSGVLYEIEQLPPKLDSPSLFKNDKPLEIEIGSGKGLFLSTESIANSAHNYLGVEIIGKYAKHSAARLINAGTRNLGNAKMISGNAEPLFESRIEPGSLEAVHVYFPGSVVEKKAPQAPCCEPEEHSELCQRHPRWRTAAFLDRCAGLF